MPAGDVIAWLAPNGWLLLAVALLLLFPCIPILRGTERTGFTAVVEAGSFGAALSLSLVPILFVWTGALGLRLSREIAFAALLATGLLIVGLTVSRRGSRISLGEQHVLDLTAFVFTFGLILFLRFANIQGFVLPLWVDSVHHSALAHLLAEQGTIPTSYRPFADVDAVYYHVGYHTFVVTLAWLSGASIEQVMLVFGQILNALAPVSLYMLAARWTGRAVGGLAAMVVAGVVSLMPAYYVTWGRYTQLEGLVILPLAMLAFDAALARGTRPWLATAAVLAAGLFLIHYRVVVFYATYVLAALLWQTLRSLRRGELVRLHWLRASGVAGLALVISAPWLWRVLTTAVFPLSTFTNRYYTVAEANAIPFDLLHLGTMPALLVVASLSALAALWLSRRCAPYVIVVLLWLGLGAVVHNPSWVGLPLLWILDNFSAVIALFVPIALLVALGVTSVVEFIADRFRLRPVLLESGATLMLLAVAVWRAPAMVNVVNPVTVLAEADDVVAMDWIKAHTPPDATFLVDERLWLSPIYAGTDGGYWIPNLTARRTTMPITFYLMGPVAYWRDDVNALAQRIESNPDPDEPSFLAALQARGVTHVYLGAKGGTLALDKFAASHHYREVYVQGAVHIFEVSF